MNKFNAVFNIYFCFGTASLDLGSFDTICLIRFWIMVRRTEKTLQHLEACVHERLPMMYDSEHPIHSLTKHKIYLTFHRHPTYILVRFFLFYFIFINSLDNNFIFTYKIYCELILR